MVKPGLIFLCSSISSVAHDVAKHFPISPKKLKLLFIDTAAEVEKGDKSWLRHDRQSLVKAGFHVHDYTLTGKTKKQVREKVEAFDVIYVSGGATFHLLEKVKQTAFDKVVRAQVKKGIHYIGSSAGALVAGPNIGPAKDLDNWKIAPKLKDYSAIGLVDFVTMPHWGSSFFKKSYLKHRLEGAYNTDYCLILLTDHQYIFCQGTSTQIIDVRK
jgi:dipeptidase E